MTKLEKVIKALECCILRNPDDHARCSQCSYDGNCVNRLKQDALELLKEHALYSDALAILKAQESTKPIRNLGITRCGNCNREIDKYEGVKYCPNCGKAVKWDD